MRHLLAAMDALVATVEQETALVRAGKLKDAAALDARKAELAHGGDQGIELDRPAALGIEQHRGLEGA